MENRVTSPSIFQLETMELKRMMKESGGGITEEPPISNPKNSKIPISTPSPKQNPKNSSVVLAMPCSSPKSVRKKNKDYLQRGQWLRAAVLELNERVVSTAWLMIGTRAGKSGAKSMLEAGLAAVAAGACSMAIGEFISVKIISLPDPIEAACASALHCSSWVAGWGL
ncbi:hypothetical protein SUGI_0432580 [Cryptomeria japonica]|nr:hypothetical protein SUGI_0432580 [Cryptomeria japonica]